MRREDDLPRTRRALAEYDRHDGSLGVVRTFIAMGGDAQMLDEWVVKRERLARAVGLAFGMDTQHINDVATCTMHVRPGDWLRRLLRARSRARCAFYRYTATYVVRGGARPKWPCE